MGKHFIRIYHFVTTRQHAQYALVCGLICIGLARTYRLVHSIVTIPHSRRPAQVYSAQLPTGNPCFGNYRKYVSMANSY